MSDIAEWVDYVFDVLPKVCYISIQLIDSDYDLEVEISHDAIGGVYGTGSGNLDKARSLANELEDEFNKRGVKVIYTRKEWDDYEDVDN